MTGSNVQLPTAPMFGGSPVKLSRPALASRPAPTSRPAPADDVSVRIDDRCTACGMCLITCPPRALLAAPGRPSVVDALCDGCGACIEVCPRDAITDWIVRP